MRSKKSAQAPSKAGKADTQNTSSPSTTCLFLSFFLSSLNLCPIRTRPAAPKCERECFSEERRAPTIYHLSFRSSMYQPARSGIPGIVASRPNHRSQKKTRYSLAQMHVT
ncbi:hypothetical protein VTN00DRAFT_5622 [Thermoascus crustaceus]|uniref:uncharacterized protein n=1 Tax=Thermoascus crustaceus TaxID=5088 RepID=UPI0037447AF2